jgi:hypothetical protein
MSDHDEKVGRIKSTITQVEGDLVERDDDYMVVWDDGHEYVFEDRELIGFFADGTLVGA